MRFGCSCRRKRPCNTEIDRTIGHQPRQAVQLLPFACVLEYPHRMKGHTSFRLAPKPSNRRYPAAITHRSSHLLVQCRTVEQAVGSVAEGSSNLFGESWSAWHDDVSAQPVDKVFVLWGGIGDNSVTLGFAELYGVPPKRSGRPSDRKELPRPQSQSVKGENHGEAVHRKGRRLGSALGRGCSGDGIHGNNEAFRVGAARASRHHDRHDLLAHFELGFHSRAQLVKHSGGIHPGHIGGPVVGQSLRAGSASQEEIGRVDRCSADGDSHLPRAWGSVGDLHHVENVRSSDFCETDGSQRGTPSVKFTL